MPRSTLVRRAATATRIEAGIGLDFHLTSLLDPKWQDQPLSPEKRAVGEALLKRDENGSEDNPPLTLLFSSLKTAAPRSSSAAV